MKISQFMIGAILVAFFQTNPWWLYEGVYLRYAARGGCLTFFLYQIFLRCPRRKKTCGMWSRDIASNFKTCPGKKYCLISEIDVLQNKNPRIFPNSNGIPFVKLHKEFDKNRENPRIFILETTFLRAQTFFLLGPALKFEAMFLLHNSADF